MKQDGFAEIRVTPGDRSRQFFPELLLISEMQSKKEDKKTISRNTTDVISEAIAKVFEEITLKTHENNAINALINELPNNEHYDEKILVIAAYLKQQNPGMIPVGRVNDSDIEKLIEVVIGIRNGSYVDHVGVKRDIIAYWKVLGE